jgi:kumamolisin
VRLNHSLILATCSSLLVGSAIAAPAFQATAIGASDSVEPAASVTVTVALNLRNKAQAEALITALHTPGNAQFHKFLTTAQFAAEFGPSAATLAQVSSHFQSRGFTVSRSATAHLEVTGSVKAMEAEFGVHLTSYKVTTPGAAVTTFRAPAQAPTVSADIADSVEAVVGLNTRPRFQPHLTQAQLAPAHTTLTPAVTTPDEPGNWTVTDFADYYDVNPLYAEGVKGSGNTVGIMTFASFTPSDALAYWKSLGLPNAASRITEVKVAGGSGAPSDNSGSEETTLDVEQSGGIASAAKVIVYEAPNTEAGSISVYAKAADANLADTISISWGEWEWFDTAADMAYVKNPVTGTFQPFIRAVGDTLIQASLQGQSVIASAGDSGAYEANNPESLFPVQDGYSKTLSVDDPAAQPYITAAGGTTLPVTLTFTNPVATVVIPTEQAWGYSYLIPLCAQLGATPVSCGIFPGGTGGGVSSYIGIPAYQSAISGMHRSPPNQTLTGASYPQYNITLPISIPGAFAGRNIPDLSLNSDPYTGYVIWYTHTGTSSIAVDAGYGGTSFAAPQLNGVASLSKQLAGSRLGLLNFALYSMVGNGTAYAGAKAPLRDITAGNNWYYSGLPGYDDATGVGVPDVANLAASLAAQ